MRKSRADTSRGSSTMAARVRTGPAWCVLPALLAGCGARTGLDEAARAADAGRPPARDSGPLAPRAVHVITGQTHSPVGGMQFVDTLALLGVPGERCGVEPDAASGCELVDCRDPPGSAPIVPLDLGTVSVTSDPSYHHVLSQTRDADGLYPFASEYARWPQGTSVQLQSSGSSAMPAFSLTATIPETEITVVFPPVPPVEEERLPTPRDADFVAQWVALDGDVAVWIDQFLWPAFPLFASPESLSVMCTFRGRAGRGTVPAALLRRFRADNDTASITRIRVGRVNVAETTVAGHAVRFSVEVDRSRYLRMD